MRNTGSEDLDSFDDSANISSQSSQVYVPKCDPALKPYVGQSFRSILDSECFYKSYGAACGFDVRIGSNKKWNDGTVVWKYFFCNREGVKDACAKVVDNGENNKSTRRKVLRRFACMARLVIRFSATEGYVVKKFIEAHTHPLFPESYRHLLKFNRKLDARHEKFILDCARANIGPVKSYRLFKEMSGSYSNVGCDVADFKNFSRDLRAFVIGSDAQIMLDKLLKRRELCSAFCVEYCVDDNDKLKRLFWTDPIARRNYHFFGETITFDATYGMNRYNMIFTPFTGKDNYGRCVTFGAGLISNEDVEAYSWILEKFRLCMGKHPNVIITDQDPALKIAVEKVLPGTRHRLCMWHIMEKLPNKIPRDVKDNTNFLKDFHNLVWSVNTEPQEFEQSWNEQIEFYELSDVDWFNTMFQLREYWLPAYFRDVPMSGLFRTTSMSESMNSFFGNFANAKADLVEFLMHFDSALEKQRYDYDKLTKDDMSTIPVPKTPWSMEKHAASMFTSRIFEQLQHSILKACDRCSISSMSVVGVETIYMVDTYQVTYNTTDKSVVCSCNKFIREGLICSHMFTVFKNLNLEHIPDAYILNRWRKDACSLPMQEFSKDLNYVIAHVDPERLALNRLDSKYHNLVEKVRGDCKRIDALTRYLENYCEGECSNGKNASVVQRKEVMFEEYYGSTIPSEISVLPPDKVNTKGSGSRLISRKEKAIRMMNKPLRKCSKCGQMARHDARNCDKQNDKHKDT